MKRKKIILSAGGTGGHLFPASRVALQLQEECELLFVAAALGHCPYFDKRFPYREIESATFSFTRPLQLARGACKIAKGVAQSRKILKDFAPNLVVGFGSYHTLPLLVAAKIEAVPLLLHEQNVIPGKVNRLFSRYCHTTAITFPASREHLKGSTQTVSFPLAKGAEVIDPYSYFGLEKRATLLIFGGSAGATAINESIFKYAPHFRNFQILHFVGKIAGQEQMMKKRYEQLGITHVVKPFESRVDLAMQIADFAICRAGAATIAELLHYNMPAVVIPYPHSAENHQEANGRFFTTIVGGGIMLLEQELEKLPSTLPLDLAMHRKCIQQYKEKEQCREFADLILELL